MSKFIIEKVIIEKSDKDIKIGNPCELNDYFNLICGQNEAGKSTLMNFLKEGFFKKKLPEKGRIIFKIQDTETEKIYIAEINSKECKIYDSNYEPKDYSLIDNTIKENYYKQGFTINLDDLSNLNDDDKLLNAIKDPSGEKLKIHTKTLQDKISEFVGATGSAKKPLKIISDEIKNFNVNINNLSNKESTYNEASTNINLAKDNLKKIEKKREYLENLKNINKIKSDIENINNDIQKNNDLFNEDLYSNQEEVMNIMQISGKYKSCIEEIENKNKTLEKINNDILSGINNLTASTGINVTEQSINDFNDNNENNKKIKLLSDENKKIEINIEIEQKNKVTIEDNISDLECEINGINANISKEYDIQEIDKYLDYINVKTSEYNSYNKELQQLYDTTVKKPTNNTGKITFVIFILLTLISMTATGICFWYKNLFTGTIIALITIISFCGIIYELKQNNKDLKQDNNEQINKVKDKIKETLEDIKTKSEKYDINIKEIDTFSILPYIENIKRKLEKSIDTNNRLNIDLSKQSANKESQIKKLKICEQNIENLNEKIKNNNKKIKELINNDYKDIDADIYLDFSEKINKLKIIIEQKKQINDEINNANETVNQIFEQLKDFIIKTNIKITVSEDFSLMINELKDIDKNNKDIKTVLDKLQSIHKEKMNALNSVIDSNKIIKEELKEEISGNNIEEQLEKIEEKKEEYEKNLRDAEITKHDVETVEGLNSLKTEKLLKIAEYRQIIKNLIINSISLELINIAKKNFDKTQPDLVNAEKYLKILTSNKYTKINLEYKKIGNDDFSISKGWSELSRGTKEQLYLALRLGYASNYTKDKSTGKDLGLPELPLIVDDIFVNFDKQRTKKALECLLNFSKTNQVLLFTCHEEEYIKLIDEIKTEEKINTISLD